MSDLNVQNSTTRIAKLGMMAAIACIFGFFRFPIIPVVAFLTYDFSDIPIIISAFAFGPVYGLAATAVVSFIQAFLLGGDAVYGFIMHMLASGSFVLVAGSIYKKRKTKKTAVISMVAASAAAFVVMFFANLWITPYYLGGEAVKDAIIELMPMIMLFNLIKVVLNSVLTFILYKRISGFLHK